MYSQLNLKDKGKARLLSRAFSRTAILDLAKSGSSTLIDKIIDETGLYYPPNTQLTTLYSFFYDQLSRYYKNEYFYKNILAEEIIKKRHKYKKVTYVNEFRVSDSIVDIAVFNGSSTAYEIKTEFDNLDRLKSQLPSYQSVFEYTYLVVNENKVASLEKTLPENIGIQILLDNNKLFEYRKSESNLLNLDKKSMLDSLRLSEVIAYVENNMGCVIEGRAQQQKNDCYDLLMQLSTEELHSIYIKIMHGRGFKKYESEIFSQITDSLLALLFNVRLSRPQLIKLQNALSSNY